MGMAILASVSITLLLGAESKVAFFQLSMNTASCLCIAVSLFGIVLFQYAVGLRTSPEYARK